MMLLDATSIISLLNMSDAIEALRNGFRQLASENSESFDRSILNLEPHSSERQLLIMPAFLPNQEALGVKITTLFTENKNKNIPLIHGLYVLLDAEFGSVQAIIEGRILTTLRTGAVTGLATDLLAPRDAKSVAIIGSGKQAKFQLEAVCCVRDIENIFIYSRNKITAKLLAEELNSNVFPKKLNTILVVGSVDEAVNEADIICTVTSTASPQPILDFKHVRKGVHINAIGGIDEVACEVDPKILSDAFVVVEQKRAAKLEAGEIIQALNKGYITENDLYEISSILNSCNTLKKSDKQITIFKSVGIAFEDLIIAKALFNKASTSQACVRQEQFTVDTSI